MTLALIVGGLATLFAMLIWARRGGGKSQAAKQLQADAKARDIADEIQGDIGAMPPADARAELKKWSHD